MRDLTPAMEKALEWLREHNGDGVFGKHCVGYTVIAGGEVAPHTRATWNNLILANYVERYGNGLQRVRVKEQRT